uniref:Uncharacterized protein n=2 Tax=Cajanus cajan TaxID=3821 RepID=A0A151SKX8_CAJCA|nr:hypothetical protein KK1_001645 [Cajanus cajan]
MEPKQEEADDAFNMVLPSKEESRLVKSQTSSRASSRTRSLSPSPNLAPFSSESLAKNAEDLVRKKGFYKSCPPPPPPPPPMMFHKSISMRPRYGEAPSFDKELKRTFTMSVGENKKFHEEKPPMQRTSFKSDHKFMGHANVPLVSEPVEKKGFLNKVLVEESDNDDEEVDDDDDDEDTETEDDDVGGERIVILQNEDNGKGPPLNGGESSKTDEASFGTMSDEGPDVDKKADEFIAKFREQIRLQRIESIKRSTKSARNSSR